MTASRPAPSSWIPELAGYRALAALAVFVYHLTPFESTGGIWARAISPLGSSAVTVFFVLSGFLIYRPYVRWAFDSGPKVKMSRFLLRRAARILPVYWLVLTVHLFVFNADQSRSLGELATAYGLVQNFRGVLVFLPPFVAWSLCVEFWFSVALPAIAAPLRILGRGRSPRAIATIHLVGIALLAAAAIAFRFWANSEPGSGRVLWFPAYLDWFAGGLGLAVWVTYRQEVTPDKPPIAVPSKALGAAVALAAYWATTQLDLPTWTSTPTPLQVHAQFLLQGLMATSLVGIAVWPGLDLGTAGRFLSSRILGWLGALSYAIYLGHPLVTDELLETFPTLTLWVLGPVALVLTLVVAQLVHSLVEKPASQMIDRVAQIEHFVPPSVRRLTLGPRQEVAQIAARLVATPVLNPVLGPSWRALSGPSGHPVLGSGVVASIGQGDSVDDQSEGLTDRPGRKAKSIGSLIPLLAVAASFIIPFLHTRGRYVPDARHELFADPVSRLERMFSVWDPTRDLGRPAEEFWPGVTLFASAFSSVGLESWVVERLWHGTLLALAFLGATLLARSLVPSRRHSASIVGLLFAFGPFSAIYLIPSTLYVGHVVTPWLALAAVRASQGRRPMAWGALVALIVFAVGNADPSGLVFAAVPAISYLVGMLILRPHARTRLLVFGLTALVLTAVTSSAMIVKTLAGASALGQRLIETETAATIAATSSFTESVRGMGFWLLYFRLEPTISRVHQAPLVENWQVMLFSLVPVIAGLFLLGHRLRQIGLVNSTDEKPVRPKSESPKIGACGPSLAVLSVAFSWFVIGTVAMVGPHPTENPSLWGRLLLWLYDESDLVFGFRSTHKAGVISALGAALLGGWALSELVARWPSKYRPTSRLLPIGLVCLVVAGIVQPFWRTPLYNPALSAPALPDYWVEVGDWFERNPPTGRVLVLPGSTNNGYTWGSVGDDILDPIVPNRVVSTTLPLSTPIASDLIDALDRHLTSIDYRSGDFLSLAQRLGISHVLIRNDLDWRSQGLAQPSDLDRLRADPDLVPVGAFGPNNAIEVLALSTPATTKATLIPASNNRRQILVEGDGDAAVRLGVAGLLRGDHPLRYASTVDAKELAKTATDTALVVLADTKLARDRRISYYGYTYAPAADDSFEPLGSLPSTSATIVDVPGATISSSLDRWAVGTAHPVTAAIDADRDTSWILPFLGDPVGASWTIELETAAEVDTIVVDLYDPAAQITGVGIKVDGTSVDAVLNRGTATAKVGRSAKQITVEFTELGPGSGTIGIREVAFGKATPTAITTLPLRLPTLATTNPAVASGLEGAELLVTIGHQDFTDSPFYRQFKLWREDDFSLDAKVQTKATETYCSDDLVSIDGVKIPVRIEPDLEGFGRLGFCEESQQLTLASGAYTIAVTPDANTSFSELRLSTMDQLLAPLNTADVNLDDPNLFGEAGDFLITSASFHQGWRLDTPETASVLALNGLTAFELSSAGPVGPAYFPAERSLTVALALSGLGLVGCLATIVGSAIRRPRRSVPSSRRSQFARLIQRVRSASEKPNHRPGILAVLVSGGLAWVAFGLIGVAAVGLAMAVAILFGPARLWLLAVASAMCLLADVVLHLSNVVAVDSLSQFAVALIGAIIVAAAHQWKRKTSEPSLASQATST